MWKCPRCGLTNHGQAVICSGCKTARAAASPVSAPSISAELLRLLSEGRKLEAIKLYKDRTGASLLDSKNAVESLERGGQLPGAAEPDGEVEFTNDLRNLLQQGKKLQAVKLYKDRTGANLMDSKKAVEALAGGGANPLAVNDVLAQELLPLLRMGERREAIRVYQRRTGARRQDAKRAVFAFARQHGAYDRESSVLSTILLVVFILAAALLVVGGIVLLVR